MKRLKNITATYLAHKEMAVKATSLNNYRQILRNHLLPEFGEKKEISEDDVQRFIVRKLSEGCSVSYVRGLCKVLAAVVAMGGDTLSGNSITRTCRTRTPMR